MKLKQARSEEEMNDAAQLMRGLVDSNKERYPDHIEYIDKYYQGVWFLEANPRIPPKYLPPSGDVLVAYDEDGQPLGTVAIYGMDALYCELKSMFVSAEHRGKGIAKELCREILQSAQGLGYKFVRLTTGRMQPEARALYIKLGFEIVPSWLEEPLDGVYYFEIELT